MRWQVKAYFIGTATPKYSATLLYHSRFNNTMEATTSLPPKKQALYDIIAGTYQKTNHSKIMLPHLANDNALCEDPLVLTHGIFFMICPFLLKVTTVILCVICHFGV